LLARSTGKATKGWATINALQFVQSEALDQHFLTIRVDMAKGRRGMASLLDKILGVEYEHWR
jgi:hypothetical protein